MAKKLKECTCPDKDEPSGMMDLKVGRWKCIKCDGYRGKPEKGGRLEAMSEAFNMIKEMDEKKTTLIEKFKEDFASYFEQDDHICPEEMLRWLERNS